MPELYVCVSAHTLAHEYDMFGTYGPGARNLDQNSNLPLMPKSVLCILTTDSFRSP
jgi:hypothetical protein